MTFCSVVLAQFSEWGWLFGFVLASLALVALAVLADALYEGYANVLAKPGPAMLRQRPRGNARPTPSHLEESSAAKRKAA